MEKKQKNVKPEFKTLIKRFQNHGFVFSEFSLECEDPCLPIDVEWNYKDLSHVRFVHSHMAREYSYVGNDAYNTFDLQKVMGITVPQSTAFYSTDDNKLIAHTTLFFIIILV